VPYLRLTADRRGVENTFLVHVAAPGEPARVLYWYRTAPGLRIGRPALDDGAMRMLEAQYPEIDFDWPYILDMGAMTPVEVEAPLPPRKRKPRRPESDEGTDESGMALDVPDAVAPAQPLAAATDEPEADAAASRPAAAGGPDLLADLLGRGIAASLRARHQQLLAEVEGHAWPDAASRSAVDARLTAIDPDAWASPEAVLAGMARIDAEVEVIRRSLG
jgi:hypothetical protein